MNYVYFIYDRIKKAVKIGFTNDLPKRLSDIQVGNSTELEILKFIPCESAAAAELFETQLHATFKHLYIRGEWFEYKEEEFQQLFTEGLNYKFKERRAPLSRSTLFGEETWGIKEFPRCFVFPELPAQVLGKYEDVKDWTLPFRTMKYPTNGKRMLGDYSPELDRVFISNKMHNILLNMNRFNRMKESEAILVEPKDEPSTLEIFFSKVDPPGKNFEILIPA
jgi:hypothetical protein